WDASGTLEGWSLSDGVSRGRLSDGRVALVLATKSGSATATFSAHAFAPEGFAHLLVHTTDGMRLGLGPCTLVYSRPSGWSIEGLRPELVEGGAAAPAQGMPRIGTLYNPTLRSDTSDGPRFASIKLAVRDGLLDVTLDDQPLIRGLHLGEGENPTERYRLSISSHEAAELSFAPVELISTYRPLYAGGPSSARVAAAPVAEPFAFGVVSNKDWTVNNESSGVSSNETDLDGRPALTIRSGKDRAVAVLNHRLGDTFSAVLHFPDLPERFILRIGPITLKRDTR